MLSIPAGAGVFRRRPPSGKWALIFGPTELSIPHHLHHDVMLCSHCANSIICVQPNWIAGGMDVLPLRQSLLARVQRRRTIVSVEFGGYLSSQYYI
jgi:hypothetical protein